LRFGAAGQGRNPVLRTTAYDVDADADLGVPADALTELLEWVGTRLASAFDAAAAPRLADDACDRAMQGSVLRRGRQRVAALAERLHTLFALPGWRLEPLRWPAEQTGELVARGPGTEQVAVRFALGVRGNRSQLGVDFQLGAGTDQHAAKPVVAKLVALLRPPQSSPAAAEAGAAPPH
jgi:hypothetical protein